MSSRWVSREEARAAQGFLARYSLVAGYLLARQLLVQDSAVRVRRDVVINYAIPLGIVVWAAGSHRGSPRTYGLSFANRRGILLHSAVGAGLAAAFVLGPAGKQMLGAPRDEYERRLAGLSPIKAVVMLGLTGLTEEVIWRGWTFSEVERTFGGRAAGTRAAIAVGASALLFSSVHLLNLAQWPKRRLGPELQQMAAAGMLGLIGGYWRHVTGSIAPGLVTHTVANMLRWRQTRAALLREAQPE